MGGDRSAVAVEDCDRSIRYIEIFARFPRSACEAMAFVEFCSHPRCDRRAERRQLTIELRAAETLLQHDDADAEGEKHGSQDADVPEREPSADRDGHVLSASNNSWYPSPRCTRMQDSSPERSSLRRSRW